MGRLKVKVTPSYSVLYKQFERAGGKGNMPPIQGEKVSIQISGDAAKKIRQRAGMLCTVLEYCRPTSIAPNGKKVSHKATFITLTLSSQQNHTDKEIKRDLMNPFLMGLKYLGLKHYVWRQELQKNGNVHFHIIADIRLGKKSLQERWNKAQEKLGYIDKFEEKHGHRNPPSTRIDRIKDYRGAIMYVAKYAGKREDTATDRAGSGRLWASSEALGAIDWPVFELEHFASDGTIIDCEPTYFPMMDAIADTRERKKLSDFAWIFPVQFVDVGQGIEAHVLRQWAADTVSTLYP